MNYDNLPQPPEGVLDPKIPWSRINPNSRLWLVLKSKLTATNDGKLELQVLKGQESFRIKSFIGSNVWALFKGGQSKFKKGELIDCYSPVGSNINIFK